jgi:hypothetical protein
MDAWRRPADACWRPMRRRTAIRRRWRGACATGTRCAPSICRATGGHRRGARRRALRRGTRARPGGGDHDRRARSRRRRRGGDDRTHRRENGRVAIDLSAEAGQFINPRGCEAAAHEVVLHAGKRLDYTDIACWRPSAGARQGLPAAGGGHRGPPATKSSKSRDSRGIPDSQFQRLVAGGAGGARRRHARCAAGGARYPGAHAGEIVERGLQADLLLLSGGVSAGKYDVVEPVLAGLGAEFYFDRVLIQPGQPLVFGRAARKSSSSGCRGIPPPPW